MATLDADDLTAIAALIEASAKVSAAKAVTDKLDTMLDWDAALAAWNFGANSHLAANAALRDSIRLVVMSKPTSDYIIASHWKSITAIAAPDLPVGQELVLKAKHPDQSVGANLGTLCTQDGVYTPDVAGWALLAWWSGPDGVNAGGQYAPFCVMIDVGAQSPTVPAGTFTMTVAFDDAGLITQSFSLSYPAVAPGNFVNCWFGLDGVGRAKEYAALQAPALAAADLAPLAKEITVLDQFGVTYGTRYPLVTRDGVIPIQRGDVITISKTLTADFPLTGRTVYFCAQKKRAATNVTAIVNRAMTITDVSARTVTITLTAAETATAGTYLYEIEVRDTGTDANPSTAEAGTLNIIDDLRK